MPETKPCVRCERAIDPHAKTCVYCNWDQAEPASAAPMPSQAASYVPPADHRARNRIIGVVALVALVIGAFFIGTFLHGFEPNDAKAAPNKVAQATAPASTGPKSNMTLIPVTDNTPAPVLEQPFTSAPAQMPGQDPHDATALPSDQYAAVAAKAKAQKTARKEPVDPRSVRGTAYDDSKSVQAPVAARAPDHPPSQPTDAATPAQTAPSARVERTDAFPEYKPMPDVHVEQDTSARLTLTVGADGRVKDVDIIDPVPGATTKIIEAVQSWRFRPATENGTPVSAKVNVTITLRGNE